MGSSSRICMNRSCGTPTSREWKTGWPLRSGGFADLCYTCGSAYENLVFCDTFHFAESGWRECSICGKHIHCGCIASASSVELLDYGGIGCTRCWNTSRLSSIQSHGIRNGLGTPTPNNVGDLQSTHAQNSAAGNTFDEGKLMQLCNLTEANEPNFLPHQRGDPKATIFHIHGDEVVRPEAEFVSGLACATQQSTSSPRYSKPDSDRLILEPKDRHESPANPSLCITLGTSSATPNFVLSSPCVQGQRSRPILPKPPKVGSATSSETNKGLLPQMRVARPPGEGRGKNQLLPRYWPRITDQELQKISGDLNSAIVPLFEKVLSASDAGRIGRLVLPKACAEAYFPSISQSEGLPLRIQDVKGKEWTFQFRFWPNNNSRMYVLEGVTPCIQSMQLRAGDTVTFSRIDPGGKLVIGFRKSANSVDSQDAHSSSLPNGTLSGEASISGVTEILPTLSDYCSIFQTQEESKDPYMSNLNLSDTNIAWSKYNKHGRWTTEDSVPQAVLISDKKRTLNIGVKSKRLLMHSDDAMELRLTWEEAQDLLRPSPSVKPSIVTIEDHEFEEYNEPPVFGKKTIFTVRPSGEKEQWAQCDDCFKWRRLPVDVLLSPKWTCSDNVWDLTRCSCSAPGDVGTKELDTLIRASKDVKKRRMVESHQPAQDHEPSGLDALASAAVLGDNMGDSGELSVGATTKHPRHRPGCTCIVCIQPPSGKGKHKASCTCNVCMTVKRRFKTLMLRKKRRQHERGALNSEGHKNRSDESEANGISHALLPMNNLENEVGLNRMQAELTESSSGQIDLNCDPSREDMQVDEAGGSLVSLVQAAALPLDNYMKQNGLSNLLCEQHNDSPGSHLLPLATEEGGESGLPEEGGKLDSQVGEQENMDQGGYHEPTLD